MVQPFAESAAIVREDFAKVAGSADGNIRPDQLSALLVAHLSREPTAEEVEVTLTALQLDGNDLSLTAWMKYLERGTDTGASASMARFESDPCLAHPPSMFGECVQLPAPDYEELGSWGAHPDKGVDPSAVVPDGESATPIQDRPCDCFYVTGTEYIVAWPQTWNGRDEISDEWQSVDASREASAFNNCCRIFAPYYRQSVMAAHGAGPTIRGSSTEELRHSGQQAMNLAYRDVEAAFDHFLRQTGNRPIIIASHSQGTMMCIRLMEKFEHDQTLRSRLVCAYLLGPVGSFPADLFERCFPSLHPCNGPRDTQCIVSFDMAPAEHEILKKMEDALERGETIVDQGDDPFAVSWNCEFSRSMMPDPPVHVPYPSGFESPAGRLPFQTNPLTWTSEPGCAESSLYLGRCVVQLSNGTGAEHDNPYSGMGQDRKAHGVHVTKISKVDVGGTWTEIVCNGRVLKQGGSGATADTHEEWAHYYFNIRQNAMERVSAFLADHDAR
eukprot:TRINITY_DN89349_c0_g1_i1.p1 TRINITY_DN89349_c0_g1~~TRINITY_DN89349_c0_g1_i1.p1  ORF type:complete len:499 (+),score=59.82 TRINITY_DN89349_c0_g1_i1:37-1533(+)